MKLIILAGGKGIRLNLSTIPKPMVKIGGKPILEHQIDLVRRYGITEIFLLTGYLANVIYDYFGDGEKFGVKITHLIEPYPMGTGGCLRLVKNLIGQEERFMVFSGDVILNVDLGKIIEEDQKKKSIATLVVHPNNHPYDSDLVEMDSDQRIIAFHPKPHPEGFYYSNLAIASIYILSGQIFKYIPSGQFSTFEKNILPMLLSKGEFVAGYRSSEYIRDMGTPDRLRRVKKDYVSGKVARLNKKNKRRTIFLDRDGVINKYVDNLSKIDDFKLTDGCSEAINKINKSEYLSIVITNQPMIAKGFLSEKELREIHKKMDTLLGKNQSYLDGVYYCPHHPQGGFKGEIKELKIECDCRKPKIGMFLQAARDFNIDLKESWKIGDDERDLIAGKNAGCRTVYLNPKMEKNQYADFVFKDLPSAIKFVLNYNK